MWIHLKLMEAFDKKCYSDIINRFLIKMSKNHKSAHASSQYIVSNPQVLGGLPTIAGTRVPISRVIFLLKDGYTVGTISNETKIEETKINGALDEVASEYDKAARETQITL